ncbi:MAG: hypothetical protein HQ541_17220 [Mariniphaga sp.]|nr:hypothetical protein [Mariniphaga sp.]
MPVQLKTLIPLFIVFISLFLVVRHFLIPESFGKYGYYRADSMDEIAALPINHVGKAICVECHDTEGAQLESDMHSGLSCEVCHGPGSKHVDDMEPASIEKQSSRDFCGKCHNLNPARRIEVINQVDIKLHYPERENCIDCHNPHAVWELKD